MAKKSVKLDIGTIYQKEEGGVYYFRYQINGERKAVSLKTRNIEEAKREAKKQLPVLQATTTEVIAAHVQHARGLVTPQKNLLLSDAFTEYETHLERATPATISEALSYKATFAEFVTWINDSTKTLRSITAADADAFSQYMRTQNIAVSTHNRKIKRIRKVFSVLNEYWEGDNPFIAKALLRREREEQDQGVRRLAFTREQEAKLLEVLDDPQYTVMHKPEVRVIYHLGMFTGQRMKDCVLLRWDKVDLNRHRIWVKQFKTGKEVTIPIALKLYDILQEAMEWRIGDNDYVCPKVASRYNQCNSVGKNVGNNLVNIDMLRVIRWIGLEPSVKIDSRDRKVTVYGFHSLRHTFASHCAEAGVPKAVVLSILGTDSDIVDKYYTHIGEEAQEKAIAAITNITTAKSDRQRIEEALALIESSTAPAEELLQDVKQVLNRNK